MILPEVIRTARELTDASKALVDRHQYIVAQGGKSSSYDLSEEQRVAKLAAQYKQKFKTEIKLVSVDDCILRPTCVKRNFRRVGKTEIPKPLTIFGDKPVDLSDKYYGCLDSLGDVPEIIYGSWMSLCWKRFIVAKELLHLYSGTDRDDDVKDADELINMARSSRFLIPDENTDMCDEAAGLFLAIEVMLPWRLRDQYLWLRKQKATDWQIAKMFMVPVDIVKFFSDTLCKNDVTYVELSDKLNRNNV